MLKKINAHKVYYLYLGVLLTFFIYAGLTGMRVLGDNKEEFKPEGQQANSTTRSHRIYRSYHK